MQMPTAINQESSQPDYKAIIRKVIEEEDRLPSLPSITLKIRQLIYKTDCDHQRLAELISLDPSLTALIIKYSVSPIFRCSQPPKTLEQVIAMIGMSTLESLVMGHSLKSLFVIKNPNIKKLFQLSWKRMVLKAAISQFLAQKLGFRPAEEALTASILTEVGTLAILTSLDSLAKTPDYATYIKLCRKFSKPLSTIILKRWQLTDLYLGLTHDCGRWGFCSNKKELTLLDIIDLAIYTTVQQETHNHDLPPIQTLGSYKKLPASLNSLTDQGELLIVKDNLDNIQHMVNNFA